MKLRVVIERITYQNGENGYSILKARVKGYDDLLTSSLRHPKCPNGQKEALMTVGQGSASLSC